MNEHQRAKYDELLKLTDFSPWCQARVLGCIDAGTDPQRIVHYVLNDIARELQPLNPHLDLRTICERLAMQDQGNA